MHVCALLRAWVGGLFFLLAAAGAHALTLDAAQGRESAASMAGELSILRDPGRVLTVRQVADASRQADFAAVRSVTAGFTQDAIWVRFTLARTADAPARWLMEAAPPFLDEVTLYAPDGLGGFSSLQLGDRMPFAQRPVHARNFVFPLDLTTAPATYYLRLGSTSALFLQLRLWQPTGFTDSRSLSDLATGIVMGAIGVMFFFNLIFGLWLRQRTYIFYSAYLVSLAGGLFFLGGHAARWLFPTQPWLADHGVGVAVCVNGAAALLFISRAMNLRVLLPWAARVYAAGFALFAAAAGVAMLGYYPLIVQYVNQGSLLINAVSLGLSAWLLLRGNREFWLYTAAFSVFAVGHVFTMLRILAIYDLGDLTEPLYQAGTLVHLVLLNIVVAHRVQVSEQRYQEEKQRALDVALQAERLMEQKVQERTALLKQEVQWRGALETQLRDALIGERLATAQQRQFVSMVSHEFRTPLAVINAVAESLSISRAADDPQVQERIRKIGRAVDRLSAMIDNYLTEDKLAMDAVPLAPQAMDLRATLDECVRSLREHAGERVHIDAAANSGPVGVYGDSSLILVALNNLVHNALKYSPADSRVSLQLGLADGMAHVDVADCGGGIAPEEQALVFDKYYRSTRAGHVPGTGLGLYLARVILQRHGGDVLLSRSSDRGSVFRLQMPLSPAAD